MCFAYKTDRSFNGFKLEIANGTETDLIPIYYEFVGDFNWHYDCFEFSEILNTELEGDIYMYWVY